MNREDIVFRVPDSGLFVSANNYTPTQQPEHASGEVTLVFAHCSSAHKDQWEDTVARLFHISAASNQLSQSWRVRDAWALDAQGYGDSPILGKNPPASRKPLSVSEYANVLRYFVTSIFVQGRSIIAIGHSESTSAWTMACAGATLPAIRAMIFIEPVMLAPVVLQEDGPTTKEDTTMIGVLLRADPFRNIATVQKAMQRRSRWKLWDERIFEAHLKHGFVESLDHATELMDIPTCPDAQAAASLYSSHGRLLVVSGTLTSDVCSRYAVHVVFGERSEAVQNETLKSKCGAIAASVSNVPTSGNLTVHQIPETVAEVILRIIQSPLGMNMEGGRMTARL
ncbi:hypothetical protein L226DRAFT_613735 [Lentinus tigrinus ALCF2SS1-7]|uniref:AB hydrolase-1 domain-containing protein n=1 Tax=Lentinus tigrinus ALCF2SS1-6 TaxID=1328759 RepID=A0A5C2RYS3_9APHY|nr:hypothetical protein L227DRAFT_614802 [Lentinus tigrinus ALCF2SS1-6]RPD73951.1 hypothetical protein L226DRAFT_613735 [Lentinus tigrinus ALCF2SS1-7]